MCIDMVYMLKKYIRKYIWEDRWLYQGDTKGYEIVQRAIVIAILFQACLFLWAMAGIYWCGYEYRYGGEYKYGDDCLIAYIRQIICYCFY